MPMLDRMEMEKNLVFPYREWQIIGGRKEQQDAYASFMMEKEGQKMQIHIIADGHGFSGGFVAAHAVESITKFFKEGGEEKDFEKFLADLQKELTSGVFEKMKGGATLNVTLLKEGNVSGFYLGDSETRLLGADWSISLTDPHRVHNKTETERLRGIKAPIAVDEAGQLRIQNKRGSMINISRAIGDGDFAPYIIQKPEHFSVELAAAYDYLITACDGFWDVYDKEGNKEKIAEILNNAKTLDEASDELKKFVEANNPHDNVTVELVKLKK